MKGNPHKYKLLQDWERGESKKGDLVYSLLSGDYGLAHADSRETGREHISVTKKEDGNIEGFTIPLELLDDLEPNPSMTIINKCKSGLHQIIYNCLYTVKELTFNDVSGRNRRMDFLFGGLLLVLACLAVKTAGAIEEQKSLKEPYQIHSPPFG